MVQMNMNITVGLKSNVISSIVTTYTSPTHGVMSANNASKMDAASEQKDSENNGLIAVYVIVPVLILTGVLAIIILIFKRRNLSNQRRNGPSSESRKENNPKIIGVDNKAFAYQYHNETQEDINTSTGPDVYEEVEIKNTIHYENDHGDYKQPENMYYDYSDKHRQIEDIVEDEFGYGQFKQDKNCYQNVMKQAGQKHLEEAKRLSFAKNKTELEYDTEPVYINDTGKVSTTKQKNDEEVDLKTHTVEEIDPLYDHAKAGGHEWDFQETTDKEITEKNTDVDENIYMNDTNNNSREKTTTSNLRTGKIPLYLELEPDIEVNKAYGNIEINEERVNEPITGDMYDYASSNKTDNDVPEDINRIVDNHIGNADDVKSSRIYLNSEENSFQDIDDSADDSASNHEYFILEKVER